MSSVIIEREAMEELLHKGRVQFSFQKKDKTTRQAQGTLHAKHLPVQNLSEVELATQTQKADEFRRNNPLSVRFWDLDNGGFRSVNLDTLLTMPALVEEFHV